MISQKLICPAPAKINLALHITGKISGGPQNGYHSLESLVVFANVGDEISVSAQPSTPSGEINISITGPFGEDLKQALGQSNEQSNLIAKAANRFRPQLNKLDHGLEISLEKNLPVSSGIGGGSADAAATIMALAKLFARNVDAQLIEQSAQLGADVPMCLFSQALIAAGVGEKISKVDGFPKLQLLLVNPGVSVSTPDIFKNLERVENSPLPALPTRLDFGSIIEWLAGQRNDLEKPAISVAPAICDVFHTIEQTGAALVRMSGSGATCFGIYEDSASCIAAEKMIASTHAEWWVKACGTNEFGLDRAYYENN